MLFLSRFVSGRQCVTLCTDGMGRTDTREALRHHYEVDAGHIVVATLAALAATGSLLPAVVTDAIRRYNINPESPDPTHL